MNKIIIGIISVIILIAVIVTIMVKSQISNKEDVTEPAPTPTVVLPTISDNITVNLTARDNNKSVVLNIKGLTPDISAVEYELTYVTGSGLPRGVLGKIKLNKEKEITRNDIVLGTCSSGKCVYDPGVTSIDLSLKFNSGTGSKVFRKTYSL